MPTHRQSYDNSKTMLELLTLWAAETAAPLFRIPNLRGNVVISFDTSSGAVKPMVELQSSALAPPTTA